MNANPPHMVTNEGAVMASAFIPFCSFGTNMKILGEYISNLTFPVCNKFTPILLGGELCYELDVKSAVGNQIKSASGRSAGLMLLLDYNSERFVEPKKLKLSKENDNVEKEITMDLDIVPEANEVAAKIYIHTLARNVGFGSGSYVLKALKKMVGTKNFLEMSFEDKQCSVELYEKCKEEEFIKQGSAVCGCHPAALGPAWPVQECQLPQSLYFFLHLS